MKHGTLSGYVKHKCRCDECRTFWNAYKRSRDATKASKPPHCTTCTCGATPVAP